jgi:hypothetical protein
MSRGGDPDRTDAPTASDSEPPGRTRVGSREGNRMPGGSRLGFRFPSAVDRLGTSAGRTAGT